MKNTPSVGEIGNKLISAHRELGETDERIAVGLIRRLAQGAPVDANALAHYLKLPEGRVAETLNRLPGVQRDDDERVIGYFGLTVLRTSEHRLHLNGRELSAWCAWDTLFLPELIGAEIEITSRPPNSDERISLTVTADGPTNVRPAGSVVSFLMPTTQLGQNTIQSFCRFIHFFPSSESADAWTAERPPTFVLSVEDAYELGRVVNAAVFGLAISVQ